MDDGAAGYKYRAVPGFAFANPAGARLWSDLEKWLDFGQSWIPLQPYINIQDLEIIMIHYHTSSKPGHDQ